MVRLVFRPYTQVRRSICTLESLRASTRVSPGFALFRHSSPSFGSQHLCSNSNLSPEDHDRPMLQSFYTSHIAYFHCAVEFTTHLLAYMLDSLVRVSRRARQCYFVNIMMYQSRSQTYIHNLSHRHGKSNQLQHQTSKLVRLTPD